MLVGQKSCRTTNKFGVRKRRQSQCHSALHQICHSNCLHLSYTWSCSRHADPDCIYYEQDDSQMRNMVILCLDKAFVTQYHGVALNFIGKSGQQMAHARRFSVMFAMSQRIEVTGHARY